MSNPIPEYHTSDATVENDDELSTQDLILREQRETNRLLGEFVTLGQGLAASLDKFGSIFGGGGSDDGAGAPKLPAGMGLLLKGMQRANRSQ